MKEVIAIIRPGAWARTKLALIAQGVTAFTVTRVLGRGRQKGLHYLGANGAGLPVLPKRLVWLWLEDSAVEPIIACLIRENQTHEIGDGKIFVCPVEDALPVRPPEPGVPAVL